MGIYDELQKISTDSPTLPTPERQIPEKPAEKAIDETVQIQGSQPTTPKQRKPIKRASPKYRRKRANKQACKLASIYAINSRREGYLHIYLSLSPASIR